MSQTPPQPSSIHALTLPTVGGTPARTGFNLQDHVAAKYCIRMMSDLSVKEVWCEAHDDITILWDAATGEEVEFVQVKNEDLDQLWSLALLHQPDSKAKSKPGTSILERSLSQHRCAEACWFRIVTSRDVKDELRGLTHPISSEERVACKDGIDALAERSKQKLNGFVSPNGGDLGFWFHRTCWEVVHSASAVQAQNLVALAKAVENAGVLLLADQVAELYKKIVRLVFDAAMSPIASGKKLKRLTVLKVIGEWAEGLAHPAPVGGTRVAEKMRAASLSDETIDAANHTRFYYRRSVLTEKYSAPQEYNRIEGEVVACLNTLLNRLDTGELTDSGPEFHKRCQTRIEDLYMSDPVAKKVGLAFLHGCMYNITDRCSHRFLRVSA